MAARAKKKQAKSPPSREVDALLSNHIEDWLRPNASLLTRSAVQLLGPFQLWSHLNSFERVREDLTNVTDVRPRARELHALHESVKNALAEAQHLQSWHPALGVAMRPLQRAEQALQLAVDVMNKKAFLGVPHAFRSKAVALIVLERALNARKDFVAPSRDTGAWPTFDAHAIAAIVQQSTDDWMYPPCPGYVAGIRAGGRAAEQRDTRAVTEIVRRAKKRNVPARSKAKKKR
jgi:hypothetical protein